MSGRARARPRGSGRPRRRGSTRPRRTPRDSRPACPAARRGDGPEAWRSKLAPISSSSGARASDSSPRRRGSGQRVPSQWRSIGSLSCAGAFGITSMRCELRAGDAIRKAPRLASSAARAVLGSAPPMGPTRREISTLVRLAVPVVGTQVGAMTMGVVDTIMLGSVGPHALAAAGLGAACIWGTLVIADGLVRGIDPIVAQAHGARDGERAALALQRGRGDRRRRQLPDRRRSGSSPRISCSPPARTPSWRRSRSATCSCRSRASSATRSTWRCAATSRAARS